MQKAITLVYLDPDDANLPVEKRGSCSLGIDPPDIKTTFSKKGHWYFVIVDTISQGLTQFELNSKMLKEKWDETQSKFPANFKTEFGPKCAGWLLDYLRERKTIPCGYRGTVGMQQPPPNQPPPSNSPVLDM